VEFNQERLLNRIANLLALIAVKGETQADKILSLTSAGFAATEVAALIGTSANTVSVTVYQSKKKTKGRAKAAK